MTSCRLVTPYRTHYLLVMQKYVGFWVSSALALEGPPLTFVHELLEPLELEAAAEAEPDIADAPYMDPKTVGVYT